MSKIFSGPLPPERSLKSGQGVIGVKGTRPELCDASIAVLCFESEARGSRRQLDRKIHSAAEISAIVLEGYQRSFQTLT
jgi:hypothetical protein